MESLKEDEETKELSGEEILRLNRVRNRYSRQQINEFVLERMTDGRLEVTEHTVTGDLSIRGLLLRGERDDQLLR